MPTFEELKLMTNDIFGWEISETEAGFFVDPSEGEDISSYFTCATFEKLEEEARAQWQDLTNGFNGTLIIQDYIEHYPFLKNWRY